MSTPGFSIHLSDGGVPRKDPLDTPVSQGAPEVLAMAKEAAVQGRSNRYLPKRIPTDAMKADVTHTHTHTH